jgi:uncharacterized protein
MDALFADTFYFVALLNSRDAAHIKAVQFDASERSLVTTAWVLTEVGNASSSPENRQAFLRLLDMLRSSPDVIILGPNQELFERGLELYRRRPDKEGSVTDCISFESMRDAGITEALTCDRHFEQAGFRALLA